MVQVMDFQEVNEDNDRVIQSALRETDTTVLAQALTTMDQTERDVVYRNMSKRAHALLSEEVTQAEQNVSQTAANKAKEFFVQKLRKYREYSARRPHVPVADSPPELDTSSEESIIESFVDLVRYARIHGLLSLEGTGVQSEYPISGKGMELVIDGWEPMLIRSILERTKATYLAKVERRLDMIMDGIDSLTSGDLPIAVEERLRAYVPE